MGTTAARLRPRTGQTFKLRIIAAMQPRARKLAPLGVPWRPGLTSQTETGDRAHRSPLHCRRRSAATGWGGAPPQPRRRPTCASAEIPPRKNPGGREKHKKITGAGRAGIPHARFARAAISDNTPRGQSPKRSVPETFSAPCLFAFWRTRWQHESKRTPPR